ncbi:MAG: 7TM diverse intracellular signaling domain-containing protein [Bacteroidota bacterium]
MRFTFDHSSLLPYRRFVLVFCMALFAYHAHAQDPLVVTKSNKPVLVGTHLSLFVDSNAQYTEKNILQSNRFEQSKSPIPIFPVVKGTIWAKVTLVNQTGDHALYLDLQYANITDLSFYHKTDSGLVLLQKTGNAMPFEKNKQVSPYYVCNVPLFKGDTGTYFIRINSKHQVLLPLFVENRVSLDTSMGLQGIVIGVYMGIILAIFLYNFFLYFSTRDKSYLIYVLYLFFLGIAQVTLAGFAFKYFWPSYPAVNDYALPITSALAGITGITFAIYFLRTRFYTPKLNPWLFLLIFLYLVAIGLSIAGRNDISYNILNVISMIGGLVLLSASGYIARKKKYKPGYFYFFAWVAFLGGMVVFVLRNLDILPYNNLTTYILYVGSAIEGILLSIALADKINTLRKEKEVSQAQALLASQENEKLVRDQNVTLERKVNERTEELLTTNHNLNTALQDLKDTQIQLVEAEKMASLGQLTAGIAHEINNPINFVKSNIKPLQLDINDLVEIIDAYDTLHAATEAEIPAKLAQIEKLKKQIDIGFVKNEISSLVKGIQEGAERTAEIVLGLRNFSRLDESEVKKADIHEGLESTLLLLKNTMPENIRIKKDFAANGVIECFPGKLNQVFMNILGNGIQAIGMKEHQAEEETISIVTKDLGDHLQISIKDSGIGMTEETKQKIFDPFFTTKDVGEGTGLGLSIVYKIIQKHEGKIEVVSSPGNGAEFIISLFRTLPETVLS